MLSLILTLACMPEKPQTDDNDGDGFAYGDDCNDDDPTVFPGADELCNNQDDDCDGVWDNDPIDGDSYWLDEDGDGYGQDVELRSCSRPEGYAFVAGDCDDAQVSVYPEAAEICDYQDNDCDGEIDEEGKTLFYTDADGDGYGDAEDPGTLDCGVSEGQSADNSDCDDDQAAVHPEAVEVCDELDNDCDGEADEDAIDEETWYQDRDEDGYGAEGSALEACNAPEGYVARADDCDDTDAQVHPYADEYCNGFDDDCDGRADESESLDATTFYRDQDGDGYGVDSSTLDACELPTGYSEVAGDCDDFDTSRHPGADEHCDDVDEDCDGDVDEDAVDPSTWYEDADSDGYGWAATTTEACDQPSGYVSDNTDCDDGDADVHPMADEYCNEVDDDCDGRLDEGTAVDASAWYADADSDGYGNASRSQNACEQPSGFVEDSTDCDDSSDAVHPGADEYCNGDDDDCDGDVDEDGVDGGTWYLDADGDGYGTSDSTTSSCDQPSGYEANAEDCDDGEGSVNPAATEICGDGVDNDCDEGTVACGVAGTHQLSKELEIKGGSAGALFGSSLASGDFDGDGFSDLLAGATEESPYGEAYLFFGPISADSRASDADVAIAGSYAGTASAVAALGDLDGDGIQDFAIGNPDYAAGASDLGGVWVFYGPASGAADVYDADETWLGQAEGQSAGAALAGIGDQDGDGLDELLDGSPGWSASALGGQVVVRSAGDSASSSGPGLYSDTVGDELGAAVLGADLDGDGTDDLVAGAPGASTGGEAYLQYGPVSSAVDVDSADVEFQGNSGSETGGALAAGDLDGDGYLDLVVSSPAFSSRGDVFVLLGPSPDGGKLTSVADARVKGSSGASAGAAVVACDSDGDGADELLVGAPGVGSGKGKSYLFHGLSSGASSLGDADATLVGASGGDASGSALGCGDTDGDGFEDLWVSSPEADSKGTDAGSVYLLTGGAGL